MSDYAKICEAYKAFISERSGREPYKPKPGNANGLDLFYDAMIGLAVADAAGVPFECGWRDQYEVTDMVGFEPGMAGYHKEAIPVGSWSDDSALTFATIDSYRRCGRFDSDDLMRSFCSWFYDNKYVPEGQTRFGEGKITVRAFEKFRSGTPADECGVDEETALGNGSLMRILPLAFYPHTVEDVVRIAALTHANKLGLMACVCYVEIAERLIEGKSLQEAVSSVKWPEVEEFSRMPVIGACFRDEIRSSGHVIETLEAALWCLLTTDNYRDCVLKAINLGRDTDTVAAVAGGLAGICYGTQRDEDKRYICTPRNYDSDRAVPLEWIKRLQPGYEKYVSKITVHFSEVELESLEDFVEVNGRQIPYEKLLIVKSCDEGVSVELDIQKVKYRTRKDTGGWSETTVYTLSCDTLRIPEKINGLPVVKIMRPEYESTGTYYSNPGEFAGWRDFQISHTTKCIYNIKKVIIPESVTDICSDSFGKNYEDTEFFVNIKKNRIINVHFRVGWSAKCEKG